MDRHISEERTVPMPGRDPASIPKRRFYVHISMRKFLAILLGALVVLVVAVASMEDPGNASGPLNLLAILAGVVATLSLFGVGIRVIEALDRRWTRRNRRYQPSLRQ